MRHKHEATEENVSITRGPSERRELIDDLNLADALRGAVANEAVLITALCSTYLTGLDPSHPTARRAATCWGLLGRVESKRARAEVFSSPQ